MKKVYSAMKSGGKFIFDVFTPKNYEGKSERKTWSSNQNGGFWSAASYVCLEAHYIYDGDIRLDQYIIIEEDNKENVFRIWDHYYTKGSIIEELRKGGFENIQVYSDVTGKPYDEQSNTMCIVVEK